MKIKCENIVVCGNYNCALNYEGVCIRTVVALNANGACTMYKPRNLVKAPEVKSAPDKPAVAFDFEASE